MDRCISFFSDMKGGNPCMYVKNVYCNKPAKIKIHTSVIYIYYVEQ